ncbi:MAG: choice-of-anchor B family protein, partial [Methylococcales bacterium]|nr:choice-of-anchor B family protein [Methylococcales bacterium]
DQSNIHVVDYVPGTSTRVVHRDYKNKGKYLYAVTDEGSGSLQIFDMSSLPDSVTKLYDSDTLFNRSHNIWIDGDRMYASIPRWTPQTRNLGMAVYDISNPIQPTLLKAYDNNGTWDWKNVHDFYGQNDTIWLNAGWEGLMAVDFSNVDAPKTLFIYDHYPHKGYNHSGWLSEDGNLYVFADENHGMPMKLLDVSDFNNPSLDALMSPNMGIPSHDTRAIAHNQIIYNDYVYGAYYYDGLYIFDISDQYAVTIAGYYHTSTEPNDRNFRGNWGVYPFLPSGLVLATDMQNGFFVLEFTSPRTAIDDAKSVSFSAYPNPTDDWITLEAEQLLTAPTFTLLDLNGRTILKKKLQGVHRQTRM